MTPPEGYTDARYQEGQAGQPFAVQLGGTGGAPDAPRLTTEQQRLADIIAKSGGVKPTTPAVRTT